MTIKYISQDLSSRDILLCGMICQQEFCWSGVGLVSDILFVELRLDSELNLTLIFQSELYK